MSTQDSLHATRRSKPRDAMGRVPAWNLSKSVVSWLLFLAGSVVVISLSFNLLEKNKSLSAVTSKLLLIIRLFSQFTPLISAQLCLSCAFEVQATFWAPRPKTKGVQKITLSV